LSSFERVPPDESLLDDVARVFEVAGLKAAIIGGQARNLWRVPRLTFDLDFTVEAKRESIEAAVRLLEEAGFQVVKSQDAATVSGPDFLQLYNAASQQVVEFQTAKTPFQESLLERSVAIEGLEPLRLVTPEDLLVLKLLAFRTKDRDDLVEIGQMHDLDWSYVEHWAEAWEVSDRLNKLREWLRNDGDHLRDLNS
jgi:hypothetical protein